MLVACLTSLVALNGKNHAGTGNSAAFTVTQPLERAQNDAFGHPNSKGGLVCIATCRPVRTVVGSHHPLVHAHLVRGGTLTLGG